jgi:hypothetical protein
MKYINNFYSIEVILTLHIIITLKIYKEKYLIYNFFVYIAYL